MSGSRGRSKGPRRRATPENRKPAVSGPRGHQSRDRRATPKNRSGRNDAQGKSRTRSDDLGGDHIEGRQAVRELLRAGRRRVEQVFVSAEVHDTAILAEIADLSEERRVPIRQLTREKLDDYALTESHQGVIAKAESIQPVDLDMLLSARQHEPLMVVALDGVTDPGNLGAILRTAEVAGVTGVVLPRHRAVRLTPAAVKAAAGAVEHLPIALVGGLPTALRQMSDQGIWVIGLDGTAKDSIYKLRVAKEPLTIVLGAEGRGLSHLVSQRCDQLVSIPQNGQLESLNVSNAAAVTIYEVRRRREIDQ